MHRTAIRSSTIFPAVIGLNIADRPYFQSALHSRDFALGDYLIKRFSGVPGVMATYPVIKAGGAVKELAASAAQGSGAEVLVVDGAATVLAASAGDEQLVGKNFTGHELTKE